MFGPGRSKLRRRSLLYVQLAQSLDAGVAVPTALRLLDSARPAGRGSQAAAAVARGSSLAAAFSGVFDVPPTHRLALEAAERAGRIPACLRSLSEDLDAERRLRTEMIMTAAYPIVLLHLVVPFSSTSILLTEPGHFATRSLLFIGSIWAVAFGLAAIHRRGRDSATYLHRIARLPFVGPVVLLAAYTRFFRALLELYSAGVRFQEALDAARAAVGVAAPVDDFMAISAAARGGAPMAGAFGSMAELDPSLRSLLVTGATAGDLESSLRRVVRDLEERWRATSLRLVRITSWAIYVLAAAMVIGSVIHFYSRYYGEITQEYDRRR